MADGEAREVYLKAYANATEARREVGTYFMFYNDQRPHQALGYRTPAEVFHQVTDVGEESAVQARKSPLDQMLVSLAGAAGLSPNSTSVLSNYRVHLSSSPKSFASATHPVNQPSSFNELGARRPR